MARFDRLTVYNTMLEDGLVPLFYHSDLEVAKKVAGALAAGGGRVLEFTNRGDFAIEVFVPLIKYCAQAHPTLIVGVGSVEDAPTAALFIAHGANFVVGPNFNEEVARLCNRRKIAYIPGCGSVTEIAQAEEWGAEIVKVFPGSAVGGPGFVKDVRGPRPWTRIMPTGGVSPDETNLRSWFSAGVAAVGMGSNLVRKEWVQAGDFAAIEETMRRTLALIRKIRAEG
ncbi:MAG: bifunctional 4-hydroxy-2-oxoglutarate aldolase/2-dehydro-3-deoxy-phosphogluconate aldolase [Anaerolineae bacterium]|jgi:2-dehydro-3-deoxyphosphogluconate aldolase/(4S)-4-hydroxy-2-oxoglutarate aldolase|nr:MAG: bifunctional 4-hydroxy-2-oxoglutarate aldolase/2-dehydro-3-deoxy-phosphogluconate aldolase [Anaerolineae bacterium]